MPSSTSLPYPVLTFGPPPKGRDAEFIMGARSPASFEDAGVSALKNKDLEPLFLVDAKLNTWTVSRVEILGEIGSFLRRILVGKLFGRRRFRIGVELAPAGSVTLDDVKARLIEAMNADSYSWYDEELAAGEGGVEPVEAEVQVETVKAAVLGAKDMQALFDAVDPLDVGWLP